MLSTRLPASRTTAKASGRTSVRASSRIGSLLSLLELDTRDGALGIDVHPKPNTLDASDLRWSQGYPARPAAGRANRHLRSAGYFLDGGGARTGALARKQLRLHTRKRNADRHGSASWAAI